MTVFFLVMLKIVWLAFIIGAIAATEHLNSENFEDFQIYRVVPKSIEDVMVLKKFENAEVRKISDKGENSFLASMRKKS